MSRVLSVYLIIINLAAFAIFGIDKQRAVRQKWRIPEKTLFMLALFGGSIGVWLGMKVFRHKTKHASFVIGIPAIFIVQCILVFIIMKYKSGTV